MKPDYGLFTPIEIGEWDILTLERPISAFLLSTIEMSDDGDMIHLDHLRAAFIGWMNEYMGPVYDSFKMRNIVEDLTSAKFNRLLRSATEGKRSGFVQNEFMKRGMNEKLTTIPRIANVSSFHYPFLVNARPSTVGLLPPDLERITMEKVYPSAHQSRIRLYEAKGALPRFGIDDWKASIRLFLEPYERENAKLVLKKTERSRAYLIRRCNNQKLCR